MQNDSAGKMLRLPQVLDRVPIGRSTIWSWVNQGRFPKPVKLSARTTAWREGDIDRFIKDPINWSQEDSDVTA